MEKKQFNKFILLIVLVQFVGLSEIIAQNQSKLAVDSKLIGTNSKVPWWLHVNQLGVIDQNGTNALSSINYSSKTVSIPYINYSYGFNAIVRGSNHSSLFLNQGYLKVGIPYFDLSFGRFESTLGLNETFLANQTVGSMIASKNATPITKIEIRTANYFSVPFTYDYFKWSASLSHGWLGGNRVVKNAYYHDKSFYLNLNLDIFQGYGGILHGNMWGGTSPTYGRLPQSFLDFLSMASGGLIPATNKNYIALENLNVFGNSVAAYDFGFTLRLKWFLLNAYRIFYHEDTVSLGFRNGWDGIWGGSITFDKSKNIIDKIGYEHMYLVRQGQLRSDYDDPEPPGVDNVYNHSIYLSGWTQYGRVLGTPLILTNPGENNPYFFPNSDAITNNIIIAHHGFVSGEIDKLGYTFHLVYSLNHGNFKDFEKLGQPYRIYRNRKEEYYLALKLNYNLKSTYNVDLLADFGADFGQLYANRYGAMLGIRFNFF